jgi:hypothetical protein
MNENKLTGYELSRNFFDWAFENPEKINPSHIAIYFFATEHQNRLGGKSKFGFPTQMVMDALGIKKYQTYIKYFNELVEWGFFILVEKSKNQYSANIISINYAMPKKGKALDKAFIKHRAKQTESNGQSTGQSKDTIDKQDNNKQINNITIELDIFPTFNDFWNLYDYKKDLETTKKKWNKLSQKEKELIMAYIPQYKLATPNKEFRKYPSTFLNQKTYKDEITTNQQSELGAIGFDNLTNFLQHERDMQGSNNLKLH